MNGPVPARPGPVRWAAVPLVLLAALNAPGGADPRVAAFLEERTGCLNAGEVAAVVWPDWPEPPYQDPPDGYDRYRFLADTGIEAMDLGDGASGWMFAPPGGSGRWGYRPHFLFEERAGRLIPVYESGATSYVATESGRELDGGLKLNGRYLVIEYWEGMEDERYRTRIHYWNGETFKPAYTTIDGAPPVREWDLEHGGGYRSARRSWRHVVAPGETLSGLCGRYRTPMGEVMRQNGIPDAGRLRAGQVLEFDSGR